METSASGGLPGCSTSVSSVPGEVNGCPNSAVKSPDGLGAREGSVIWAFALAAWGTIVMIVFHLSIRSFLIIANPVVVLWLVGLLGMVPILIGLGVAISCLERRLPNPPIIWVAVICNIALSATWMTQAAIGLSQLTPR
jgi:hypothetical protein